MKTAKHILGTVMVVIAVLAFMVMAGEPTEEAVHPILMQIGAFGVLALDITAAKKIWPEMFEKDDEGEA